MAAWLLLALAATPTLAQEPVTFRGKTITMIVGSQAGGGTDATGRLMAPFLAKYLPGNPTVIVENRPGADGIVALNYFVQQVKPDGFMVAAGDSPQIDPIRYRAPQSRYDPTRFEFVGGIGRGGSMIIMDAAAEKRLSDKSAPPVTIGVASSVPRSGQAIAAWGIGFLGWNAKWVVGYRGTSALMLALQQGELDMTATSNTFSLQHLIDSGKFKVLVQSGGLQDWQARAAAGIPQRAAPVRPARWQARSDRAEVIRPLARRVARRQMAWPAARLSGPDGRGLSQSLPRDGGRSRVPGARPPHQRSVRPDDRR
jgi:tripartite-type tricarboxylate transporter receptor subunit TctC